MTISSSFAYATKFLKLILSEWLVAGSPCVNRDDFDMPSRFGWFERDADHDD